MNKLAKVESKELSALVRAQELDERMDKAILNFEHGWRCVWEIDADVQSTRAWESLTNSETGQPFRNITEWRNVKLAKCRSRSRVMQIIADGRVLEQAARLEKFKHTPENSAKELVRHFKTHGFGGASDLVERANKMPEDEFKPYIRSLSVQKLDSKTEWRKLARLLEEPPYEAWKGAEAMIKRARDIDATGDGWHSETYEGAAAVIAYVGEYRIRQLFETGQIEGFPRAAEESESQAN